MLELIGFAYLLVLSTAIPTPPTLPTSFAANVTITIPIVGDVPSTMYYDLAQSKQRIDQTSTYGTVITIDDYVAQKDYQISGGTCTSSDISAYVPYYSLTPYSLFVKDTVVNNRPVQHWRANIVGQFDWFIDVSDAREPELVLFTAAIFGVHTRMAFTSQIAGPQDPSLFDVSRYGCTPPPPPVTYSVNGFITDAVTGQGIAGATATLTSADGSSTATSTSGSDGMYSFAQVTAGSYTITASAPRFTPSPRALINVNASIPAGTSADVALSPLLSADTARAVLKWGSTPNDLDTHFFFGSCQVSFLSRTCSDGNITASLDRDATAGYGPETLSISGEGSLKQRYFVYIYTTGGTFSASSATVAVYSDTGAQTVSVPSNAGSARWWHVFDRVNDQIEIVNKIEDPN